MANPYTTPVAPPAGADARQTSPLAITSLVLGILSCLGLACFLAPFGLTFGIISLVRVNNNKTTLKGAGLAIAGIATSVVSFAILAIIATAMTTMMPITGGLINQAKETQAEHFTKALFVTMQVHAFENEGVFPRSMAEMEDVDPEIANFFNSREIEYQIFPAKDSDPPETLVVSVKLLETETEEGKATWILGYLSGETVVERKVQQPTALAP